ncbi:hypothetical protein OAR16_00450 [bacterium]|nr:hypothetical protein [bacterium]
MKGSGEVHIVNMSGGAVVKGDLYISGRHFKFGNILQGKEEVFYFDVGRDSHYRVKIEFESGKKLEKELGYVIFGFDYTDTLMVNDGDIVLLSKVRMRSGSR